MMSDMFKNVSIEAFQESLNAIKTFPTLKECLFGN